MYPLPPLLLQNPLWIPGGFDPELDSRGSEFIRALPNMHHRVLHGGRMELSEFAPTVKLYILAHGHDKMPLFTTKTGRWTADELVQLLVSDGLSNKQRDIELLVCFAGESVNTREAAEAMMRLREPVMAALAARNQGLAARLEVKARPQYERLKAALPEPQFFETNPEKLLFPLAAQLSNALRQWGFTNFRIISYKCPVAQYNPDAHVYLDVTPKGQRFPVFVSADDPAYSQYRVVWH